MPSSRRVPIVALLPLLQRRFPGLDDPERLIKEGAVLVDGVPAASPRTRVRADAVIRIRQPRPLRGTIKLARALAVFGIDPAGAVALDLGAAAGGFTQALLDAGAARVYAVDAGAGQLRGWLRADPRVISLERTNLARLTPHLIGEPAELVTMDLSYLAVADAIGQLDRRLLAPARAAHRAGQADVRAARRGAGRPAAPGGGGGNRRRPGTGRPRLAGAGPGTLPDQGGQGRDRGAAARGIRAAGP